MQDSFFEFTDEQVLVEGPNSPFRDSFPQWQVLIRLFHLGEWAEFVTMIFLCLQVWISGSHFFQDRVRDGVSSYMAKYN